MRGQKSLKLKEENGQKVFTACRRRFEVFKHVWAGNWYESMVYDGKFLASHWSSVTHFLSSEVYFEALS